MDSVSTSQSNSVESDEMILSGFSYDQVFLLSSFRVTVKPCRNVLHLVCVNFKLKVIKQIKSLTALKYCGL